MVQREPTIGLGKQRDHGTKRTHHWTGRAERSWYKENPPLDWESREIMAQREPTIELGEQRSWYKENPPLDWESREIMVQREPTIGLGEQRDHGTKRTHH